MNPLDLSGKRILVTGASNGIGQAAAIYLSRLGARIIAVGRNPERLEKTRASLEGEGHIVTEFDLAAVEQIPAWMRTIVAASGPLDGLLHSAGIVLNRPLRVLTPQNLEAMQRINVDAAVMLTKGFRQKGVCTPEGSSIVYLASIAAIKAKPALAGYAATKGALIALTRTLALELAPERIRVNCLCPGLVRTGMLDELESLLSEEQAQKLAAEYPLGFGTPDDVACAAAFLLAPSARWITGTALVLDGGYSL